MNIEMKHNYSGTYENIYIRQLKNDDLESLRIWRNNPDNTHFLRKIPYITQEMQTAWYKNYLNDETELIFSIEEIENIHGLVGSLALYNIENKETEVGKILVGDPNAHGLDVCANSLKAICQIAKAELALNRIYLHVYADNIPAVKAYEKAGFVVDEEHNAENGLKEYTMSILL